MTTLRTSARQGQGERVDLESLSPGFSVHARLRRLAGAEVGWGSSQLSAATSPPLGFFCYYPLSWRVLVPIHALGALSVALESLARQLSFPVADTPGCYVAGASTHDTRHARSGTWMSSLTDCSFCRRPSLLSLLFSPRMSVSDSFCRSDFLSGFWSPCTPPCVCFSFILFALVFQ